MLFVPLGYSKEKGKLGQGDYSFSTYVKFSEKLTVLTP